MRDHQYKISSSDTIHYPLITPECVEVPYLSKNSAPKTVNLKRIRDYLFHSNVRVTVLILFGAFFGLCWAVLYPIYILVNFLFMKPPIRHPNNYCRNDEISEGIIHQYQCSITGRHYTMRFYDPSGDVNDIPALYASGFSVDPLAHFMFPNKQLRHRYSTKWYYVDSSNSSCDIVVQEWDQHEKLVGMALFSQRRRSFWCDMRDATYAFSILFCMMFISPRMAHRVLSIMLAVDDLHSRISSSFDKLADLKFISVEAGFQKQGIGLNLLTNLIAHFDALQIPVYLKASNSMNVPFYEKFGFRVFEEHRLNPECPPLYLMLRMPKVTPTLSVQEDCKKNC